MILGERILSGTLTRAGTFPVRDEEQTGFVITCSVDYLRAIPTLPMYQPVIIITEEAMARVVEQRRQVETKLNDALVENAHLKEELGKRQ